MSTFNERQWTELHGAGAFARSLRSLGRDAYFILTLAGGMSLATAATSLPFASSSISRRQQVCKGPSRMLPPPLHAAVRVLSARACCTRPGQSSDFAYGWDYDRRGRRQRAVSYTHLTLPTICSV